MQPCLVEGSATPSAQVRSRYRDVPPPSTFRAEQHEEEVLTFQPQVSEFAALYSEWYRGVRLLHRGLVATQARCRNAVLPRFDLFGVEVMYRYLSFNDCVVSSAISETIMLSLRLDISFLGGDECDTR